MMTTAMPMIFGISERLCSWIWVTAWKTLITRPMRRAASRSGPATFRASVMACEARLTTVSWFIRRLLVEALNERLDDQVPAVDQDEQQDLERQRDERGRQHDHAHAHQGRGDDQVDDQERQEDQEADLKCGLQLGHDEGWDQHLGGDFSARMRRLRVREADEQRYVLHARLAEHEFAQRLLGAFDGGGGADAVLGERF